jgi:colanic acid/amylovoran biosynthesis glycosyltransferase
LTLVGEGPLHVRLAARAGEGLTVRGRLDPDGVADAMRAAAAVVVPSTSPEALPLVVLEAFAHGRPVLATSGGGLAATVTPDVGLLAAPTVGALSAALAALPGSDLAALGRTARARYLADYAPEVVMAAQLQIYRDVLSRSA